MHCLAKDPTARYQSAHDVALTLRALLDSTPVPRTVASEPRPAPAHETPHTHYARSGDVNIASQVAGDGPLDLVFVMGWITHLEYFWQEPSFVRFLPPLASL